MSNGPTFWQRKSSRETTARIAAYVALSALAVVYAIPFLWSLSASLKPFEQVYAIPHEWIPKPVQFENYIKVFQLLPFHRFFLNTIFITGMSLFGMIGSACFVGYSFARIRWPGREFLFVVLLSTLMLPAQVTMIPVFMLFQKLGLYDTYVPLILPAFFGGGVFNIFLLRQFFKTIPTDLEDAAKIDGCSHLRILLTIMVPLAKPAIATLTVLSFIGRWNDFMTPLIYLRSYEKFPIAVGLNMFKDSYGLSLPHLLIAASTIALIPVLITFFLAQRYFVRGIVLTGIKG